MGLFLVLMKLSESNPIMVLEGRLQSTVEPQIQEEKMTSFLVVDQWTRSAFLQSGSWEFVSQVYMFCGPGTDL